MAPTFTFRNIEATNGLRNHALEKLKKLDRFVKNPINVHVIFNVERFEHIAEITLSTNGHQYVGVGKSSDMYPSIDDAVVKILKQLKRDHDRTTNHKGE